jgi:hypothetical protein
MKLRIGRRNRILIAIGNPNSDSDAELVGRDYYDVNWITIRIDVSAGSFYGVYSTEILRDELVAFRSELGKLYSFEAPGAHFNPIEHGLYIDAKGDGRGNFEARCEAKDGNGNALKFNLEFDQTDIPQMTKELDEIIAAYPVIGEP